MNAEGVAVIVFLSRREQEIAKRALQNHLILDRILKYLPINSMLVVRLVNKTWKEGAARVAISRMNIQLSFHYTGSFRTQEGKTLRELNDLIRNSKLMDASSRFPCGAFYFNRGILDLEELQEFLSLHGTNLKSLELDGGIYLDIQSFRRLLVEQAPNINRLIFEYSSVSDQEDGKLFSEEPELSKLRFLSVGNFFGQMPELLEAAKNLKEVRGNGTAIIQIFSSPSLRDKIHIIKELQIIPAELVEKITSFESFSNASPKLESLEFTEFEGSFPKILFCNALSKLLDSSSSTLRVLSFPSNGSDYFTGATWKGLEKVTTIKIQGLPGIQSPLFPPNFISDYFPNVQA